MTSSDSNKKLADLIELFISPNEADFQHGTGQIKSERDRNFIIYALNTTFSEMSKFHFYQDHEGTITRKKKLLS